MTYDGPSATKARPRLCDAKLLLEKANQSLPDSSSRFPTVKSLRILRLLSGSGHRKVVYNVSVGQADLARKLHMTRQALSLHFKKLKESGFVQIGRGFVNITEDGLRAAGYRKDPVIVTLRVLPQRRSEAIERISRLPVIEIFRVTGDVDVVLIVEQDRLDHVLELLSEIDGIIETRSLVSLPARHENERILGGSPDGGINGAV